MIWLLKLINKTKNSFHLKTSKVFRFCIEFFQLSYFNLTKAMFSGTKCCYQPSKIHGKSTCHSDKCYCYWKALDGFFWYHTLTFFLVVVWKYFPSFRPGLFFVILSLSLFCFLSCRLFYECVAWEKEKSRIRMSRKELNLTTLSTAYH